MLNRSQISIVCIWAAISLMAGCTSSRLITHRSEMPDPRDDGYLVVLTSDQTLYKLTEYKLTDSLLIGTGEREINHEKTRFSGQLPLMDIEYIMTTKVNTTGTLAAVCGAAIFGSVAAGYLKDDTKSFTTTERRGYYSSGGGGGGCCPILYAHDGEQYRLQAEGFPGAICRSAERASYDHLPLLNPAGGKCDLKLINEKQETDYVNEVKLLAVDAPPGVTILADVQGDLHTISHPVSPISCHEFSGRDVRSDILECDNLYWECDLNSKDLTRESDLKDGLILEFPRPGGATRGKLVVRGANTQLGSFALDMLYQLKGDQVLRWYQQLEGDETEWTTFLEFMRREGMLHIHIWANGRWKEQAVLRDPGAVIAKDQLSMLDFGEVKGDQVKIKLESTTDLWRIDQVYLDYSPDVPIHVTEVAPEEAVDESGGNVLRRITADDHLYHTLFPGQSINLSFDDPTPRPVTERVYLVKLKGYYYRWPNSIYQEQADLFDRVLTEPCFASKSYLSLWREVKEKYE